jgi:hypothetical protein
MLQVIVAYFLFLFAQLYAFSFHDVNGRLYYSGTACLEGCMQDHMRYGKRYKRES